MLLICSLLTLQGLPHAEPRYSDYVNTKMKRLLLRAELALASGQLISPPNDNALLYLERILTKNPTTPQAPELLNQLFARFMASNEAADHAPELARMKNLKAMGIKARRDERLVRRVLRPALVELKDCRVSLGLASLQLGEHAEAGRQQRAAARLVVKYQMEPGGLSYLSRRLAENQSSRASYEWKRYAEQTYRPTQARGEPVRKYLRKEFEKLKDCRVSLGLASLQLGDQAEARNLHKAAADLAARYQLKLTGVNYLAQLVEQGTGPPARAADKAASYPGAHAPRTSQGDSPQTSPSRDAPRVFGTF
ncbi:MAG: hypothetical protein H0V34_05890 [Gammaproteobacteria bacterium]|nr:hypothetical protein [Gammaproteobacteria bacterium]MBA3731893.1 hypothetical protein [Gammaproteobacteria bacterium]